jgi:hypothetical protein
MFSDPDWSLTRGSLEKVLSATNTVQGDVRTLGHVGDTV